MGFLVKGVCVPDLVTAKTLTCNGVDMYWGATTSLYTHTCTSTPLAADANMTLCRRLNGGACTNITHPYPVYQSCAYDGSTSMQLDFFGAVLSFLVIVWVASRLYRKFWNNHEAV